MGIRAAYRDEMWKGEEKRRNSQIYWAMSSVSFGNVSHG
jgi:hypothetical protein